MKKIKLNLNEKFVYNAFKNLISMHTTSTKLQTEILQQDDDVVIKALEEKQIKDISQVKQEKIKKEILTTVITTFMDTGLLLAVMKRILDDFKIDIEIRDAEEKNSNSFSIKEIIKDMHNSEENLRNNLTVKFSSKNTDHLQ